jgi:hypothetical protein
MKLETVQYRGEMKVLGRFQALRMVIEGIPAPWHERLLNRLLLLAKAIVREELGA